MKKLFYILVLMVAVISLVACGNSSYASQAARNCRKLFPEIGLVSNVYSNTSSCADVVGLADILAYGFNAVGVEDLGKWTSENTEDLINFRIQLAANYIRLNGKISNVSCEQLIDSVTNSFSKSALEKYLAFYIEINPVEEKNDSETTLDGRAEEIEVVELFDDAGQSMLFELLTIIDDDGSDYFLVTSYDVNEAEISADAPADVFILKKIEKDGSEMLEPVENRELMERIFDKFRDTKNDVFDFV